MGIIFDKSAKEKKLYSAYGLNVYGIENWYDWTIYPNREREICYVTLRICNDNEEFFNQYIGNLCIMKENFDRTIDNFLYWINTENPSKYDIEKMVFEALTSANGLFNYRINNIKQKEKRRQMEKERIKQNEKEKDIKCKQVSEYCNANGMVYYEKYDGFVLLKPLNDKAKEVIKSAIMKCDCKMIESYIDFAKTYPDNKDLKIVFTGSIDETVVYVNKA